MDWRAWYWVQAHTGKNTTTPQNNPNYVKHPLELMTSLHCLVAMVTLNSRWQRKSGTCAQVFFFFSSNHQSCRLFLASLLLSFFHLSFLFPHPHPSFSHAWRCQVPSQIQPPRNSRNQHKNRDRRRRRSCCDVWLRQQTRQKYRRRGCTLTAWQAILQTGWVGGGAVGGGWGY